MCFFSVIIPVYNVEKYLEQCIQSILEQSYSNFELFLVDDGSSDQSSQICDKYAAIDPKVKVIHKVNGGVTSARKEGLLAASGEYVVFVDADDWLDANYLEKFNLKLKEYNCDIVCCNHYKASASGNAPIFDRHSAGFYDRNRIEKEIFPALIQAPYGSSFSPQLWGKAIRRTLISPILPQISPLIKIGEDGACMVSCVYNATSIYIMDEHLYYYRTNNLSATKVKKAFRWDGPELVYKHIQSSLDLKEHDFQQQLYRRTCHALFNVARTQFYRSDPYNKIVNDIKRHLNNGIYAESIKKCNFYGSAKGKIMEVVMKNRLYFWMYILSRFR